ncbi:PREDICTED: uncharacterized protein LOC107188084 [Dufourea novaeangliae]|uniref:uncharacterized protein LOC107188084 n=1 Tax=Dufourea novaeangliae TaxID=178035 RepID=UPI0007678F84|nr:PREDICTED: uncharacterized protein LOC107188084 [Dufourea novaeangliae]
MWVVRDAQSPPTGEKTPVLLCDEESSSDDDVFFCSLQRKLSSMTKKYSKDDDSNLDNSSKKAARRAEKSVKQKEPTKTAQDNKYNKTILDGTPVRRNFRLNQIEQVVKKHISLPKSLKNPHDKSRKNSVQRTWEYSSHQSQSTQIMLRASVGTQVEDCLQHAEKSISSFSNTFNDNNEDISDSKNFHAQLKTEEKSPIISDESASRKARTRSNKYGRERFEYARFWHLLEFAGFFRPKASRTPENSNRFSSISTCTQTEELV